MSAMLFDPAVFVRGDALMTAEYIVPIGAPEDVVLMQAWESRTEAYEGDLVTMRESAVPDFAARVVGVTSDFQSFTRLYKLREAP